MSGKLSFNHPALQEVTQREWLVTNGIGGYAASTICGMNTRRYHGLLVASLNPPTARRVLVSRIEETVHLDNGSYELATNQYPGAIHPQGYKQVSEFTRNPFPQTAFRFEGAELRKTLFMPDQSNTTIIAYHNASKVPMKVDLRPHLVDRDYHSLFFQSDAFTYSMEQDDKVVTLHSQNGAPPLFIGFSEGIFHEAPNWYYNVEYLKEQARGLDFSEHTFQPGYIQVQLNPEQRIFIVLTLERKMLHEDPVKAMEIEINRRAAIVPQEVQDPFLHDLLVSADQFLVRRESTQSSTLIAGYPWFTDWGRDTMIAIRGLTIVMGKQDEARSILETFSKYLDQGMLPNRFPDEGEIPEYNTVDATLWLFVVLYEYVHKFGDWAFVEFFYPQLQAIIHAHLEGTRYNIHVDGKGLLFAGNDNTQLTWMDALMWGHAFTPRWGCPVEVNALWYNALRIFEHFSKKLDKPTGVISVLCKMLKKNFRYYFLNSKGYLNDTLVPEDWVDDKFRPNQLYALSLPFPLLNNREGKRMLKLVKEKLLTPYGLRTLASDDPDFKPVYQGKQWDRDSAYHQGTVWPFLLGEYYQAKIQVEGFSECLKEEIKTGIQPLKGHFYSDGCIHGISEIFDGEKPLQGKGTFHQAWSVSTLVALLIKHQLFEKKSSPLKETVLV